MNKFFFVNLFNQKIQKQTKKLKYSSKIHTRQGTFSFWGKDCRKDWWTEQNTSKGQSLQFVQGKQVVRNFNSSNLPSKV